MRLTCICHYFLEIIYNFSDELKKDVNGTKMRKHRMIYVTHQIANAFGNDLFSELVQFGLYAATTLLICFIFGAFKFTVGTFVVITAVSIVASIVLAISLKAAMTLAISCHTHSRLCCEWGLEQLGPQNNLLNKLFWKSQRPLSIRIGGQFILDSHEYIITIFGTIVLQKVIDLLLTF